MYVTYISVGGLVSGCEADEEGAPARRSFVQALTALNLAPRPASAALEPWMGGLNV